MTVKQLYRRLCEEIPASLSWEWDNDGLMLCRDGGRPVRRILTTLDVTDEAVDYAVENGFDLILSHHPLLFRPLTSLDGENYLVAKALRLLDAGISVISLHTRADAVADGVNDRLGDLLGLGQIEVLGGEGEGIVRVGELPAPVSLFDFAETVKCALGAPAVLVADANRPVLRVALCGGEGGDFVSCVRAAGADTYVSGRIGYHKMTDAPEMGLNMIEAGHFYTETHVTAFLAEAAAAILPEAEIEEFSSNIILCL